MTSLGTIDKTGQQTLTKNSLTITHNALQDTIRWCIVHHHPLNSVDKLNPCNCVRSKLNYLHTGMCVQAILWSSTWGPWSTTLTLFLKTEATLLC